MRAPRAARSSAGERKGNAADAMQPRNGSEGKTARAAKTTGAQSIRRAIAVLRILAEGQEHGARLTDIVAESRLNRPTVHRILRVLTEEGAVEQDAETRRYRIGEEVSLLGLARISRFPIRAVAEPYLQHLCDEIGDTVFLTIRSGFDSICVDRKIGSYPVKVLAIEVGARRPLGVGVAGIALLASLPKDEANAIIKTNEQRLGHHRLSVVALAERIRTAREKGYAYAEVGVVRSTSALAVPVFDASREPIAAISVSALADRLRPQRAPSVAKLMSQQAELISRRLAEIARAKARSRNTTPFR